MKVLLDTHAFLWWITDDPRISSRARDVVQDAVKYRRPGSNAHGASVHSKRVNGGSAAGLLPRLLLQRLDHIGLLPGVVVHEEGSRDTAVDVAVEKVEAPDHPGGGQVEELLDDSL